MTEILLHAKTKQQALRVIKSPPQALLIIGPAGSGKLALASSIAAQLLGIKPQRLANYAHFILIQKPDAKQEISIDAVRHAVRQLRLKAASGPTSVNRVVLINDAHLASATAQNALLKAIEEPPAGTVFILTALSAASVLPTIASRAEKIPLVPIGQDGARKYYKNMYDEATINGAWLLSGGAAGLLDALLADNAAHPLKQSVETAKKILRADRYDRILILDGLSGDKGEFFNVLLALSRVLASLHHAAIKTGNNSQAKRLITARQMVNAAAKRLDNNTSAKLTALYIALRLPV